MTEVDHLQTNMQSPEQREDRPPAATGSSWRNWLAPAVVLVLLSLVVGAVYSRSLRAPFVYDDYASVVNNPSIRQIWPLFRPAGRAPFSPQPDLPTSGRPLVNLSLAVNFAVGGLSPFSYHVFNVAVHILNALLLWGIMRRALRLEFFRGRFDRAADPLAFLVALLWAMHPLQTETVQYLTQRTELMVAFFYLATLYASLRYFTAPAPQRNSWWWAAIASCLAGMACKEIMVTAPVMVLLFDRTFVSGSLRSALQQSWQLYAGLASAWLLLLVLNISGPRSASAGFALDVTAWEWWLTQTKVFFIYLKLAVWPWPLVIHYELPYFTSLSEAWPWVTGFAVLGLLVLFLYWWRTAAGYLGVWVFAILSPTLCVPIVTEMAAERRMYLPLAALVVLFVLGVWLALQGVGGWFSSARSEARRWGALTLTAALVFAIGAIYAAVDVRRLNAYDDLETIWADALRHQPENTVALASMGAVLVNTDRAEASLPYLQHALEIDPGNAYAQHFLGAALLKLGNPQQATEHLLEAVKIQPRDAETHQHLGLALVAAGRFPEALEHLKFAAERMPPSAELYGALGAALTRSGQVPAGVEYLSEACRLAPQSEKHHSSLAVALLMQGKQDEAVKAFETAVRLNPDSVETRQNLGVALLRARRLDEAIGQFEAALRTRPSSAETHDNLGIALLQAGRLQAALESFQKSLSLGRNTAELQNNLGTILLRNGKTDEAIEHFEAALRQDPNFRAAQVNLEQARQTRPER